MDRARVSKAWSVTGAWRVLEKASKTETPEPTTVRSRGLLAGAVAKSLDIGVQTLHFYEREGLIPEPPRSESGYRLYTPEIVERVRFIRKAQALGLLLDEIKQVLELVAQGSSPCGRVQNSLAEKLADVDRRLQKLHSFRDELARLTEEATSAKVGDGAARICSIVETAMPKAASESSRDRIRVALRSGRGAAQPRS